MIQAQSSPRAIKMLSGLTASQRWLQMLESQYKSIAESNSPMSSPSFRASLVSGPECCGPRTDIGVDDVTESPKLGE
jgi:hypothetical protein